MHQQTTQEPHTYTPSIARRDPNPPNRPDQTHYIEYAKPSTKTLPTRQHAPHQHQNTNGMGRTDTQRIMTEKQKRRIKCTCETSQNENTSGAPKRSSFTSDVFFSSAWPIAAPAFSPSLLPGGTPAHGFPSGGVLQCIHFIADAHTYHLLCLMHG